MLLVCLPLIIGVYKICLFEHRHHCGYLILRKLLIMLMIFLNCVTRYQSKMKMNNFLSWISIVAGREVASRQALMWKSNMPVQVLMAEGFLALSFVLSVRTLHKYQFQQHNHII